MGFGDIHAFNLAMLAKQAWRLIQENHTFFYFILEYTKAHYFHNCLFMEADLGHNPSFVWRSFLETKDLIWAAIIWKVGDGRSIKIDDHRWLPHPSQFTLDADKNMRVCDLFNPNTRQWHLQLLLNTFRPTTVANIQLINLGTTTSCDKLIWKENKKGVFSIKTAYRVASRMKQVEQEEHSSAWVDKKMWNCIWQLHVPPKVRNFFWQVCSDILLTRTNLC